MQDREFLNYIEEYDVISLLETWCTNVKKLYNLLPGYKCFGKVGQKTKKKGRCSGGIVVFVKEKYINHFSLVETDFKHGVFLKISEIVDKECIFGIIYLPPENSTVYNNESNGISQLDGVLEKIVAECEIDKFILTGDFNARTGLLKDYIDYDNSEYLPSNDLLDADIFNMPRNNVDKVGASNNFGRSLIDLCIKYKIHIVNGRKEGDKYGEITCITANGTSVVDYTIVSTNIFDSIESFTILPNDRFTHFPQSFTIIRNEDIDEVDESEELAGTDGNMRLVFRWSAQSLRNLNTENAQNLVVKFNEYIDSENTCEAAETVIKLMQSICTQVRKRKPITKDKPFWDNELEEARKFKYKSLRLVRLEHSEIAMIEYRLAVKRFKSLFRRKQKEYQMKLKERLENSKDVNELWKIVKNSKKKTTCEKAIKSRDWIDHFKVLLNNVNPMDDNHAQGVKNYIEQHDVTCNECKSGNNEVLNRDFELQEVNEAINSLSTKKAPGMDGIVNEIIKEGKVLFTPLLCRLFNSILKTGIYPENWCKAVIVPIHKGGKLNDTNNYRGISLLSNVSKVFCRILNQRLVQWANDNELMYEEQAGFTKGKSTNDQVFILYTCVQKYLKKRKGRCYGIFVDFAKAFDKVPHSHLFYNLYCQNAHGRLLYVLKDMYSKLKACVQVDERLLSNMFDCNVGTRQGCIASPFLFIFYLNELIRFCKELPGIQINENKSINMLLYADDLVILGDHVGRVQTLLNKLNEFCFKWGFAINLAKTKAMVFRRGGVIKQNEHFYFNGQIIENVRHYKYLGVLLSTRLSFSPCQKQLVHQARRALLSLSHVNFQCDYSLKIAEILFDKCVLPIVTYGSEIWGNDVIGCVEELQMTYFKNLLRLNISTSNVAVRGDLGRHTVALKCKLKTVKYWFKLLAAEENSLLSACYKRLYRDCENNVTNWVTGIKKLLQENGFGSVWLEQGVENITHFMKDLETRLKDIEIQNWRREKQDVSKLRFYTMYKTVFAPEPYLYMNITKKFRNALARLRMSSHKLAIETGRHQNIAREDRLCIYCGKSKILVVIECEYHFLLECHLYQDLRDKCFKDVISGRKTMYNFVKIMKSENVDVIKALSNFIYCAFSLREAESESV